MQYTYVKRRRDTVAGRHAIVYVSDSGKRTVVAHATTKQNALTMVSLLNMGLDAPVMGRQPSLHDCVSTINAPALADSRVIDQVPILN